MIEKHDESAAQARKHERMAWNAKTKALEKLVESLRRNYKDKVEGFDDVEKAVFDVWHAYESSHVEARVRIVPSKEKQEEIKETGICSDRRYHVKEGIREKVREYIEPEDFKSSVYLRVLDEHEVDDV